MNDSNNDDRPPRRPGTRVVTGGRDPASFHGFVNPPVYHASTVLYRSAADYVAHRSRYQYGRRGGRSSLLLSFMLLSLASVATGVTRHRGRHYKCAITATRCGPLLRHRRAASTP